MHLNEDQRKVLDEGDIIELKEGNVYAILPVHCLYSNKRGVFDEFAHDVVSLSKCEWLQGKYIVYKTAFDGGGQNFDGPYPNGHHVFCEKMDGSKTRVDFYQSGSFTAMIYDLEPIGEAELTYTEKEINHGRH